jgi:Phage integrase family
MAQSCERPTSVAMSGIPQPGNWSDRAGAARLRHTAASLATASGADVKVVQQMLGHKSATMTLDLYGHLFEDRLDEVADRLDAAARAAGMLYSVPTTGTVVDLAQRRHAE